MCASRAEAPPGLARTLGATLLVWLLPSLTAATLLLQLFNSPLSGVPLHGLLMLGLLLTALLPVLPDLLRAELPPLSARRLAAAAMGGIQLAMLVFYALAYIGHRYWGNWINLDLLLAYAPQLPDLLQALSLSSAWLGVAAAALVLSWLGLSTLHLRLLARLAAARAALGGPARPLTGVLLLLGLLASLMGLYRAFYKDVGTWWYEPLRQASLSADFGQAGMGIALSPRQLQTERAAAEAYPPQPAQGPLRPLVLIIVDALRSDLTGVYGAPVDNTPFLSAQLRAGRLQRVEDAHAVCTVSYCGILGVLAARPWHEMTPQPWGLADALKRLGYDSRFILSGDHTSFYGLRTMYGTAPSLVRDGSNQQQRYTNDDRLVLDALDAQGWPKAQPGFLYVHLMSAHRLGRRDEAMQRWTAANAPSYSRFEPVDPKDHPELRARYHNGILQADDMIRQIFERLARWGVLDDAMVIITADHGDMIGELGRWSHGHAPYEPVVRIPLLVYDRHASAPLPPRRLASQVDIGPTFLRAIGAPVPAHWPGRPLQQPYARSQLPLASAEANGLVMDEGQGRFKYLRMQATSEELLFKLNPQGGDEAHNLAADPAHAATLARLRASYNALKSAPPAR